MNPKTIKVGNVFVLFILASDERITLVPRFAHDCEETDYKAEIKLASGNWLSLGQFRSVESAMRELYIEREGFTAAYGDD